MTGNDDFPIYSPEEVAQLIAENEKLQMENVQQREALRMLRGRIQQLKTDNEHKKQRQIARYEAFEAKQLQLTESWEHEQAMRIEAEQRADRETEKNRILQRLLDELRGATAEQNKTD